MKFYIISVVIIGIVGALIRLLSPHGEGGGLKNHVKLAIGIAIIPISIFPLTSFIEEIQKIDVSDIVGGQDSERLEEYESIFEEGYLLAEEDNLKIGIADILKEKFEIDPSECYISVKISTGSDMKRRLERIFINLYGSAIWKDTVSIEKYLSSLFGCETVIAVG